MPPNIDLHAAAVLLWLPKGQIPRGNEFDQTLAQPPPSPNPEAWWLLYQAVKYAHDLIAHQRNHDKDPWIKWGMHILSPKEIIETYNNMGAKFQQ